MPTRLEQLQGFLQADPHDSFIRYALAMEYQKMGRLLNAISDLEALRRDDPEYVGLYYHLGQLYEEMDRADDAMTIYEEGIEVARRQSDFHALSELNTVRVNLEMGL